ncbi:MAG: CHAT domain-containing protein [Bacteroidales bacterium]
MMLYKLGKLVLSSVIVLLAIQGYSSIQENIPDGKPDTLNSMKQKAIQMARKGKFNQSREIFHEILKHKREIYPDHHPQIADAYINLGVIYKKQGYYNKSLAYYKKAENIYDKQEEVDDLKLGTSYLNMANIFSLQKDKEKAELYYNKAISLYNKDSLKNIDRLASVYNNLGTLYNNLGLYIEAISNYKKSLEIKRKVDPDGSLNTLVNLANTYHKIDSNAIADQHYEEIINKAKKEYGGENYHLAKIYMNYGVLKLKQQDYSEAEKLFNNALKIYRSSLGDNHPETSKVYSNLGDLHYQKQNIKEALNNYQRGLIALSEEFNDTSIFSNPKANNVFLKNELLEISKRKARKLEKLGKKDKKFSVEAIKTYDLAIRTTREIRKGYISEESKLLLTAEERDTYMQAMETALQLYKETQKKEYINKAFSYAEGSKAAVLYESIQSNQALNIGNIPDSLKERENILKNRVHNTEELIFEEKQKESPNKDNLEYWENQLFSLKKSYDSLIETFENDYPRFYELKYNLKPVQLEVIQERMDKSDILIEYVIHEDKLYAFIVDKENIKLHQSTINESLPNAINHLKNSISKRFFSNHNLPDMKEFVKNAYYIYSKVIEPLDIPKNKKITIIPDDILAYIPFEILLTSPQFEKLDYSSLKYLLQDYSISYDYSAKVLYTQQDAKGNAQKKLAGFAPSYDSLENPDELKIATREKYRDRLYPLKGIKEEVNKITKIIRGDSCIDGEATEKNFKEHASKYDILHLAMHTILNDNDPMFSKMAFTQPKNSEEDGFLNTYEIYNLNLNSRMTILSSCNTGVGKLSRGEGVMSLARGFKYAGCPSIIMTLWPVEDNSSIKLMEYFYEEIKKGENKEEALRKAKLRFLNNADMLHAHPYFWSGYILIGDKEELYQKNRYYYMGGILILLVAGLIIFIRLQRVRKYT